MTRKQRMSGVHYIKSHCVNVVLLFGKRFLIPKGKFCPNIGATMSILAISLSIAILIIVMSVMNGFTKELIEKILGLNSHITIYSLRDNFGDIEQTQNDIQKIKGIKFAFPVVSGSGMVVKNDNSAGVFVKAIAPSDIKNNKDLSKSIIADLDNFKNYNIILGKDIARQLRVKKGDEINMIVPIVADTMFGTIPRQVRLKVAGIINSHSQQYDNYMAIIPFKAGQVIFNMKDNASSIEIVTENPEKLDDIEKEIAGMKKYYIADWKMENSALLHALKVEANVMSLILGLFVLISTFTIFAVIRMMIKSKERDIAILKAHGISNKQIRNIFFIVGFTICITGMFFGNVLGISFAVNVDRIRIFLENLFHTKLLDGDVYLLSNLPSRVIISDIIKANCFAFAVSLLCIYLSIAKNTKIDITKTLRSN